MSKTQMGVTLLLLISLCSFANADWPRFRGPNGEGIAEQAGPLPTKWSNDENVAWKAPLPGPGVSSPIIVGDRVFVTSYSGYGIDRTDPGEMSDLKRHLVCIDLNTGKTLWDKSVAAVLPEDPYSGMGVPSHGYASHTPVSDGERVYVFFGKTGALAFDFDGNQLWQTGVGTESDPRRWGSASSPVLYENVLIVTAAAESEAVVGLDTATGKELWRKEASGLSNTWGTPVLARIDDQRTDLVLGVPFEVWGFDPTNGKFRWYCEAMGADQYSPSVVTANGVIFGMASSRGGGGSVAIRPGGDGDVTETAILWTGDDSSRFATPLVYENRLYSLDGSIANCFDATTGERIYRSRMSAGSAANANEGQQGGRRGRRGFGMGGGDYSSPVIGDGKIYFTKSSGQTFVVQTGDKYEQIAVNSLGDGREVFSGSPAISDGSIFLRSNSNLYRIKAE